MQSSVFKSLTEEFTLQHNAEAFYFKRAATEGIQLPKLLFQFWLKLTYWKKQQIATKCFGAKQ